MRVEGDDEDRRRLRQLPGRARKKFIERYAQLEQHSATAASLRSGFSVIGARCILKSAGNLRLPVCPDTSESMGGQIFRCKGIDQLISIGKCWSIKSPSMLSLTSARIASHRLGIFTIVGTAIAGQKFQESSF